MAQAYSISDLAREFDITTRTIRFYEEKGLLSPGRNGQHRVYSSADRTILRLVLRGKRCGLSLDESREIIALYQPGEDNIEQLQQLKTKINERRGLLNRQLEDIHQMLVVSDTTAKCKHTWTEVCARCFPVGGDPRSAVPHAGDCDQVVLYKHDHHHHHMSYIFHDYRFHIIVIIIIIIIIIITLLSLL